MKISYVNVLQNLLTDSHKFSLKPPKYRNLLTFTINHKLHNQNTISIDYIQLCTSLYVNSKYFTTEQT